MSDRKPQVAYCRSTCALCGQTIAEIGTELREAITVVTLPIYPCRCLIAFQLSGVPAALRCLLMTRSLSEAQMIFHKFGGGSNERADTTQNEARSNRETVPQVTVTRTPAVNSTEADDEAVPAANKSEGSKAEGSEKMLAEFRAMAMQLHTYHSNVGPQERMQEQEWANCQYHYCRDRFALAYAESDPGAMATGSKPPRRDARAL